MDEKLLQQLKDIHLPKAITLWPTAPGWIIGAILILLLLIYSVFALYRARKNKATLKFARSQLKNLQQLLNHNPDNINIAAEISTLIRRTALHYFPRQEIAGLTGDQWLTFLLRSGTVDPASAELLLQAPYQKMQLADLQPLFTVAEQWLTIMAKQKRMRTEK